MKIIFLNIYQGFVYRGAERSTAELCRRFARNNQVTLIQGGKNNIDKNYKTVSFPVLFSFLPDSSTDFLRKFYLDDWSLIILFFSLFTVPYLLRSDFEILVPVNGGWQAIICKLVSIIKKRKLVIIGRAGIGRDDAFNLLLKPDLFIALTKRAQVWAKKINSSVEILPLPNGIDLNKFNENIKPAAIDLPSPVIISSAALIRSKQLDLTIKAVARLKDDISLLILGSGPLFRKLSILGTDLLGKKRFKIISVSQEKMASYYRSGKIFTLASVENEAFGNVYLEAMACNLPVVAPFGYRLEIIGDAGTYFQQDNIGDYSRKLEIALKKEFKNKPRKQAEKFSWDEIFPGYEKAFTAMIKKS